MNNSHPRELTVAACAYLADVVVGGAELELHRRQPLEVVADRQLLGHTHSAVQLHGLLADEAGRPPDRRLRGRHRPRAYRGFVVEVQHGEQDGGECLLHLDVHIDHAVLEHLEAADRHAELLALLAVFDGVRQYLSHATDGFRTDRGCTFVARLLQ